ncbi:FAD/NAD(P)-binding protein [Brevundimonas sp. MF30-B]|nr:FAD/NAD(P)-binding protein [Brevundimonas sp. MF30-B]
MMSSIAFVGAGPTTLYALKALLRAPVRGVGVTVFEAEAEPGVGSPYRAGWNGPSMLSNIASAEIPPVTETLLAWLQGRADAELRDLGVEAADLSDRTFVPRVALGRYFRDQFERVVDQLRSAGACVDVRAGRRVDDVAIRGEGVELRWSGATGAETGRFDHVVLATGHQWPSKQESRPGYFTSPWPAATLAALPPTKVGVRGSSLTAIDAAIAVAGAHGAFTRGADGRIKYEPAAGTEGLRITLMSRKGLLPEADFYFPLPHPPLTICTPQAIAGVIEAGGVDLLDRAFDLFRREMAAVDPAYVAAVGLQRGDLEAFGEAYFADRMATDPFVWAATNLAEAQANHQTRFTVPWRDALLRLHEVMASITPHLDKVQFDRFSRHLKPVFVDAYGAAPHESVERMLALHRAGKLEVLALGDDHMVDTRRPEGGARLTRRGISRSFPVFIEGTGQRILGAIQFPFLSLIEQGVVRDAGAAQDAESDKVEGARGVEIDDHFSLVADGLTPDRLFCLSLPFILGRHPFAQGLTSSHEMGEIVGRRLAVVAARSAEAAHPPVDRLQAVA